MEKKAKLKASKEHYISLMLKKSIKSFMHNVKFRKMMRKDAIHRQILDEPEQEFFSVSIKI